MKFEVLPIVDKMIGLYSIPLGPDRFDAYLKLLQGSSKGDLRLPIGGFNPMAKDHVFHSIRLLKQIDAEELMFEQCQILSEKFEDFLMGQNYQIALNLADDLKGGWTNRFTTDFESRFSTSALLKRHFITPYFWTSEQIDAALVKLRTAESCRRAVYQLDRLAKPITLGEHFAQESFALAKLSDVSINNTDQSLVSEFLSRYQESEDYQVIFNFFYGAHASRSMNFKVFDEIPEMGGLEFARSCSE